MEVIRVTLSNQYFLDCHEYPANKHTVQVTEIGILYVKKGAKVVVTYSPNGWLDVQKVDKSTVVDSQN